MEDSVLLDCPRSRNLAPLNSQHRSSYGRLTMNPVENNSASAATRLCLACGLCCNGAMFHQVRLQPADSAKSLAAVGMMLKHKRGLSFIQQPCCCFKPVKLPGEGAKPCQCSIYAARPERCRVFECRQLALVESAEISEAAAMTTILEAKRLEAEVEELLARTGNKNRKLPLVVRCERVLEAPADPGWNAEMLTLREQLRESMRTLSLMLNRDFRVIA